jgi:hypothetical protein
MTLGGQGMWRIEIACPVLTNRHVMLNVLSAWRGLHTYDMTMARACLRVWIHAHTSALHTMYDCNVLFPILFASEAFSYSFLTLCRIPTSDPYPSLL